MFQNLVEINPERYTIYAMRFLNGQHEHEAANTILAQSIQNHPDSPKYSDWIALLGER